MDDEVQNKRGADYGLYLAAGIVMWLIAFASFGLIINLRELRIGKILFVVWLVFIAIGWLIFAIGCVKRFKAKYYK